MVTSARMAVQWFVSPQELGPISAALNGLMVAARQEPGCIFCHLLTEVGKRVELRYVEEWRGEEELKEQLRSPRFSRLAELVESATDVPRIEFQLPDGTRGMDYALAVREGGSA